MMPPWIIATQSRILGQYDGLAFFVFIFYYRGIKARDMLINHERIHFWQQLELLFFAHWLLYLLFYVLYRFKGLNHNQAYMAIPFEREAYQHEHDATYLKKRKAFAWLAFIK